MIKRLLATNLILALIISSFNLKTKALIPTDYEDPNCINLTSLGVGRDFITYYPSRFCPIGTFFSNKATLFKSTPKT